MTDPGRPILFIGTEEGAVYCNECYGAAVPFGLDYVMDPDEHAETVHNGSVDQVVHPDDV
jgi:hypothetical protein